MKKYICKNCHKLVFGKCPVCFDKPICRVDGCSKKMHGMRMCEKHYNENLNGEYKNIDHFDGYVEYIRNELREEQRQLLKQSKGI
ncbi:MAG: hypothetical protein ACTSQE_07525 [Candidatus Heimdallarchaeaceae archaeon]